MYSVKFDSGLKDRNFCDGPVLKGRGTAYAKHYTDCISQPGMQLFWVIVAIRGWIAIGADADNAFVQSTPPKESTFMQIDDHMAEWIEETLGTKVDFTMVLPVLCTLQGHPEAESSWTNKIEPILINDLNFVSPAHEPCLYIGNYANQEVLIGRQIDDFKTAALHEDRLRALRPRSTSALNLDFCRITMALT
jgi:hypothetical protein